MPRNLSKLSRADGIRAGVMLRKDNKSPAEIKVLDRFAEQSVVEEIQPWEESKDALG